MPTQSQWRHCSACQVLFFDGFNHSGVCAATPGHSGEHTPDFGFNFQVSHDDEVVDLFFSVQRGWRNCHKCQAMYYGPTNGPCPGLPAGAHYGGQNLGGTFPADTFDFFLLYGLGAADSIQDNWRACWKCLTLVYDGFTSDKGPCQAGGLHEGHGGEGGVFNFALNFLP